MPWRKAIRARVVAGILILVVVTIACGGAPATVVSHGGPVTDYVSLIDGLRAAGATVEPLGTADHPFFSVPGQMITVDGEVVWVFVYTDAASVDEAVGDISADGSSIGTTMAAWTWPPHFYRASLVLVLYIGGDTAVMRVLEDVLGEELTGR